MKILQAIVVWRRIVLFKMDMHFMVVFMYNNIPRNALGSDIENKTWNTRYGLYLFYKYHTIDEFRILRGSFREDRVESSCLHPGQDKYQKLLLRRPKRMGWAGTPPFTWLFWIYWKLSIWLCKLKSSNPWWGEYGSVVSVRGVWLEYDLSSLFQQEWAVLPGQ